MAPVAGSLYMGSTEEQTRHSKGPPDQKHLVHLIPRALPFLECLALEDPLLNKIILLGARMRLSG